MPPIKLPPTPSSAYNPNRPPNALLLAQVRELERAVRAAGRRVQGGRPKTEGEVAAYMRLLTRALHNQVLLPALKRRPLRAPRPLGKAGGSAKASHSRASSKPARKARPVNSAKPRGVRKPRRKR